MTIAIIDYGSGNLRSAEKSFARASAALDHPRRVCVVRDAESVAAADYIVLPGVGAFADCMAGLMGIDGMAEALHEAVRVKARPFLGICVGMQLLLENGLEDGTTKGLGWLAGDVATLDAAELPLEKNLKVPHMGWNTVQCVRPHPVFDGLAGQDVYFVHSFCAQPKNGDAICATTEYGGTIVAALAHDTYCGTQFHPEKSQAVGSRLIGDFLRWCP